METDRAYRYLLEDGVHIVHYYDHYDLRSGGCTIAYRRCTDKRSNRMVECSVAYCAPGDTYTKQIGVDLALERFEFGNTVTLPIGNPDDEIIRSRLINLFGMYA